MKYYKFLRMLSIKHKHYKNYKIFYNSMKTKSNNKMDEKYWYKKKQLNYEINTKKKQIWIFTENKYLLWVLLRNKTEKL